MSNPDYPDCPGDEELARIREWPVEDWLGLMAFVRERWAYADVGYWTEVAPGHFEISTAGWSGNEDLVDALHENAIFWSLCWLESRRGGHFKLQVPEGLQKERP